MKSTLTTKSPAGAVGAKLTPSPSVARAISPLFPRHRPSGRDAAESTTCHAFDGSMDAPSTLSIVGQVASGAAWAAAAYMGYRVVLQQGASRPPGERECERCGGSGTVECFCTRWSDAAGDNSGCGTCGGSHRMSCTSCGGGGTAVPIEARVFIRREDEYRR